MLTTNTPYYGMTFAYLRVSTLDPNTQRQKDAILNRYPNVHEIFEDQLLGSSEKTINRIEFQKMNQKIREGDTLIVESLSILAKNARELKNYVLELNQKNVKLISLKENVDTTHDTGKSGFGKLLLDVLRERQKEGIQIAKQNGKYKGLKPMQCPELFDYYSSVMNKNKRFKLFKLYRRYLFLYPRNLKCYSKVVGLGKNKILESIYLNLVTKALSVQQCNNATITYFL